MDRYERLYSTLNHQQKEAVDKIDGPLLVLAGPGTGKTQLLSMRVANILRQTDELSENILCLTYSEAGVKAMRDRLTSITGQEAYRVGVFTFHGFGSEVINRFPEYFYEGADVQPADELAQHRLLEIALSKVSSTNYFVKRFDGDFTMLSTVQSIISDVKRAGLTPEELTEICNQNLEFIDFAEPLFNKLIPLTMSKSSLSAFTNLLSKLTSYRQDKELIPGIPPLSIILIEELMQTIREAEVHLKVTPPLTQFKNHWKSANWRDKFVLKAREQTNRLLDATAIYVQYHQALAKEKLFDYDDMIIDVVHELEKNSELRANLQEQYHYILIDEYQDTNLAQYRILKALTENPINEGKPNIMVVGDDDQAIYAFQGANISNVSDFIEEFPRLEIITLTQNYRSPQEILDLSRSVIVQGMGRLETRLPDISKKLHASDKDHARIERLEFETSMLENAWLAREVKRIINKGTSPKKIAIISAKHKQLINLIPQLHREGIAVTYEKSENVLEEEHIKTLLKLAQFTSLLHEGSLLEANALLPGLLNHEMWDLSPQLIWNISLEAYTNPKYKRLWLEAMRKSTDSKVQAIAEWLIECSLHIEEEPLEQFLDRLIGVNPSQDKVVSPFYKYYFDKARFTSHTREYVDLMEQLTTLRQALRDYKPSERLYVGDLLEFVSRAEATNTKIINRRTEIESNRSIQLMSAHGAKGLEFDVVFIIDTNQDNWVRSSGRYSPSYPANMVQLKRGGYELNDRLRLFYVALTRAKKQLILTRSIQDIKNKDRLPVSFLVTESADQLAPLKIVDDAPKSSEMLEILEADWRGANLTHIKNSFDVLSPILDNFKLSATALDNFLDVEYGGPQIFLEQNLLKFPYAVSPYAAFGDAVHKTLYAAHISVITGHKKNTKELLEIFTQALKEARLATHDENHWLERGKEYLEKYLKVNLKSFNTTQIVERDFSNQGVIIENARLSGRLDVLEAISSDEMLITDYKTGTPISRWSLSNIGSNHSLYKYRRQLIFYKLLVENSKDYGRKYKANKAVIDFIQPTKDTNELIKLTYDMDNQEVERVQELIKKVWQHIFNLNFPDISKYEKNLRGVVSFENDLLNNDI